MKKPTTSIMQGSSSVIPGRASFRANEFEKPGCTSDQVQEIKDVFDLFDPHRTNLIKPQELLTALNELGSQGTEQAIYRVIRDAVDDGKYEMDFSEFLDLMTQRVSTKDTREDLKKVFNLFDEEKSGFISIKTLKRVIKDLGENIDEHELQQMITKADEDNDGVVSEEEFYNIMTRKTTKT